MAAFLLAPPIVRAADDANQEIENSKYQAEGRINSNAVYIRSGASENDYPTMKLDRGAPIVVVGGRAKFDWLKIIPPEGSYCYVAKAYVEKRGDGTLGRVTSSLNVRVGSTLNAMKTKVAARLEAGEDVKILGEQDEYFKIAPPASVYLYVNKQFVDLVKTIDLANAGKTKPEEPVKPPTPPAPDNQSGQTGVTQTPLAPPENQTQAQNNTQTEPTTPTPTPGNTGSTGDQTAGTPPTEPQTPPVTPPAPGDQTADSGKSATKPADAQADAETQFDKLEKTFIENDRKTIDQQPIAEMQKGYEKLAASTVLPESLRRMAEYRVSTLKQRAEDQQRYLAVKKSQEEMRARQVALQAEREELETRIKNSGVKYFAAVGTLRVSSLQQGGGTLYRLTDPKSGRTVVYVRSDDPKLGSFLGQFIGVGGTVQNEKSLNLKVVTPTGFEAVDQSKVNISIAAQVVPPSMMPSGMAGTGSEINP